jgi:hypothetical protein
MRQHRWSECVADAVSDPNIMPVPADTVLLTQAEAAGSQGGPAEVRPPTIKPSKGNTDD